MPIKNAQGKVIGVTQLINKLDGSIFNKNDENLFEVLIKKKKPFVFKTCQENTFELGCSGSHRQERWGFCPDTETILWGIYPGSLQRQDLKVADIEMAVDQKSCIYSELNSSTWMFQKINCSDVL